MDISFMTNAGGANDWSLDECATWAKAHDFDCLRLGNSGVLDPDKIRAEGPDEVLATLRTRRLVDEPGDADPATQAAGAQGRSPGRRVARLGRRSRLSSGAAAAASGTTLSDVTTVVRRML